jgi:hypothetical protein
MVEAVVTDTARLDSPRDPMLITRTVLNLAG